MPFGIASEAGNMLTDALERRCARRADEIANHVATHKTVKCKQKHDTKEGAVCCPYWHTEGDRRIAPFDNVNAAGYCGSKFARITSAQLYKTTLCRGPCGFNSKLCAFAHDPQELLQRPPEGKFYSSKEHYRGMVHKMLRANAGLPDKMPVVAVAAAPPPPPSPWKKLPPPSPSDPLSPSLDEAPSAPSAPNAAVAPANPWWAHMLEPNHYNYPSANHTGGKALMREAAKNDAALEETFCVICMESTREMANVDCGHRHVCGKCVVDYALDYCPTCMTPASRWLQIYL